MAAAARASALMMSRPVTFVTGNAKKLEEVRAILGNSIPFQSLKLDCKLHSIYSLSLYLSLSLSLKEFIYLFSYFAVPELQGEPEDISKEKARLAAIEVRSLGRLYHMYMCMYVCLYIAN